MGGSLQFESVILFHIFEVLTESDDKLPPRSNLSLGAGADDFANIVIAILCNPDSIFFQGRQKNTGVSRGNRPGQSGER